MTLTPIYEQTLATDDEVALVKALPVRVDEGSSLKLRCIVAGSSASVSFVHDKADDVASLPDVEITSSSSTVELSISKYNHKKHHGVYDCTIRDGQQRLHRRAFRVEERVGESTLCDNSFCHQNGLCAKDEEGIKFCYCKNGYYGERCEQAARLLASTSPDSNCNLHTAALVVMFASFVLMVFALVVFFAKRQNKKMRRGCQTIRSVHQESIKAHEMEEFCGHVRQVLSTESAPEGLLYNLWREDETARVHLAALNREVLSKAPTIETPKTTSSLAVHFVFPPVNVSDTLNSRRFYQNA